jgi:hypothetical protein
MRHFAVLLLTIVCACVLLSCAGGAFFLSTGNNGSTVVSTSGTVSIVQLTTTDGGTQVTVVTLLNVGTAQTLPFCGDVVHQFPTNTSVTVNFNPGTVCNTTVQVTIN